jgi:diphthamide synthase subunit DPH2
MNKLDITLKKFYSLYCQLTGENYRKMTGDTLDKTVCVCGGIYYPCFRNHHLQTKKHVKYIKLHRNERNLTMADKIRMKLNRTTPEIKKLNGT